MSTRIDKNGVSNLFHFLHYTDNNLYFPLTNTNKEYFKIITEK